MSRTSRIGTTENTEVTEKIMSNLAPDFVNSLMLRARIGDISEGE
jgi:hypothetical protein